MCGRPEPEQFPFNVRIAVAIDLTPIETKPAACGRTRQPVEAAPPDPLLALASNPQVLAGLANMAALMFRE